MPAKNIAVFGIYLDQLTAEDAVDSLKRFWVPEHRHFCLVPRQPGHKGFCPRETY